MTKLSLLFTDRFIQKTSTPAPHKSKRNTPDGSGRWHDENWPPYTEIVHLWQPWTCFLHTRLITPQRILYELDSTISDSSPRKSMSMVKSRSRTLRLLGLMFMTPYSSSPFFTVR